MTRRCVGSLFLCCFDNLFWALCFLLWFLFYDISLWFDSRLWISFFLLFFVFLRKWDDLQLLFFFVTRQCVDSDRRRNDDNRIFVWRVFVIVIFNVICNIDLFQDRVSRLKKINQEFMFFFVCFASVYVCCLPSLRLFVVVRYAVRNSSERALLDMSCWVFPVGYSLMEVPYRLLPIGHSLLGLSYWVCPIGNCLLGTIYWECPLKMHYWILPIGYVLLEMVYWLCRERASERAIERASPIGYVLLGIPCWVFPIGCVLLDILYWTLPIGHVLLSMSYWVMPYWVCPIEYFLLDDNVIYGECPTGYGLLSISYWISPLGNVLFGMLYWVSPIGRWPIVLTSPFSGKFFNVNRFVHKNS